MAKSMAQLAELADACTQKGGPTCLAKPASAHCLMEVIIR